MSLTQGGSDNPACGLELRRTKLSSAIKDAVGVRGSTRELFPRTEVEVLDLDTTTDVDEVMHTVQKHIVGQTTGNFKVNIIKRAFRASLKA